MRWWTVAAATCAAAACGGGNGGPDGSSTDGGAFDASDAGSGDAGIDAAVDAGLDAAVDAGPPDPVETYFADVARERCRRALLCETRIRTYEQPGIGIDLEIQIALQLECHDSGRELSPRPEAIERRALRQALRDGRVRFDATAAADCVELHRSIDGCDEPLPECGEVFEPLVPEGGTCRIAGAYPSFAETVECVGLPCIVPGPDVCEGTCAPAPDEGESCRAINGCRDGLFCESGTCTRASLVGEVCDGDHPCEPSLFCTGGTCGTRSPLGSTCSRATPESGRVECEIGLECAELPDGSLRCMDLQAAGVGDPCYWLYFDTCPEPLVCHGAGASEWATCGAAQRTGAECSELRACVAGDRCVAGTCVHIVMPGEACGADRVCPRTHLCEGGACVERPLLGEPCDDGERRCLRGMCLGGVCGYPAAGELCDGPAIAPLGSCEEGCLGAATGLGPGTCGSPTFPEWCGVML